VIVEFIDANREDFGVEPICSVLQVAPSTYYEVKSRPPSARAVRDAELKEALLQLWTDNYCVYGVRKLHKAARSRRASDRAGPDRPVDALARHRRRAPEQEGPHHQG